MVLFNEESPVMPGSLALVGPSVRGSYCPARRSTGVQLGTAWKSGGQGPDGQTDLHSRCWG